MVAATPCGLRKRSCLPPPCTNFLTLSVATLLTADGDDEALTVARLVPHLGGEPESRLIAVARWLGRLYPPPGEARRLVIAPLEPDRLGEVLVSDVLAEHPGLLAAAIDAASGPQLARALTVTGRAAREDQAVNNQLRSALDDRLPDLIGRGLDADGSDLLSAVTTATIISRPARGAADAAARFPDMLPVWLRPLAVTLTAIAADGLRAQASDDPAAIPLLAGWLNNLAYRLSGLGRPEKALETASEAAALYRQLAEASPDACLPNLAGSLNNLANRLSEAGQTDQAEELFADTLAAFSDSTRGIGHILLARGRWRAGRTRLADAIPDLAAAVSTFDRDDDRVTRGQTRLALRTLRESDQPAFDRAWAQANGPLPGWLDHLTDTQQLADKIIAWVGAPDWQASRTYLDDNATDLLTDEAQAATEHLIDINPAADTLHEHLELRKAARTHGTDAAYAGHQEQLLTSHLIQTLGQWLATRTWTASRAFAAAHSDDLLHPGARGALDDLSSQNPADPELRLHRGLLAYAATAGFDAAYDLLADTDRQRVMSVDPATPAGTRLATARMRSGQADDDPEAHFELAALTLLAIPQQAAPEAAALLAREAAAALADCAANAAPYEQRDFARRLSQLGTEHPPLAALIAELQHILTGKPDADPSR